MFERASNGWSLAKASWEVLKLDRELLVFPLLSGVACLIVMASFALPLAAGGYFEALGDQGTDVASGANITVAVAGFIFYFVNYFIIVFFNSALVACAIIRFRGGDPTLADGFHSAVERLPQILAWTAVSATVGMILRGLESRSRRTGQFVGGMLGMTWTATTYFVIPIIVVERVGPFEAISRSLSILRRHWGESLAANFGIGIIVTVAMLIAAIPGGLGVRSGDPLWMAAGIVISATGMILVALVSSALSAIVTAAIYEYATTDKPPAAFDAPALEHAFVHE
jgi:hypothetical protein